MKLSEVFNQLAYGELSQLAIVDSTTGLIPSSKYPQMVSFVNLGLMELYKRFNLKQGTITFTLDKDVSTYVLSTDGDTQFVEGIYDEEFVDDILKVEKVTTSSGYELGLNDASDPYGCVTPSAAVLKVPLAIVNKSPDLDAALMTDTLTISYRASHPAITIGKTVFTPSKIDIELPSTHLEPLLYYIASRVHNPIGMTNEFHAGNSYAKKYEMACQRLEVENLEIDQGSGNERIRKNGWV